MHFSKGTILQSCAMAAAFFFSAAPKTHAQEKHEEPRQSNYSAFVMDAATGKILYSRNGQSKRTPASMTKVMTAYLVFEDLRSGRINFDTQLDVSENAAYKGWTHIHLAPEDRYTRTRYEQEVFSISVYTALLGILVQSGNDAATVIAENLGRGDDPEGDFVRRMNGKAAELGMKQTRFTTPTGWPHGYPYSTGEDMAILARAIMTDFPEYYPLFSVEKFSFRGVTFTNHNSLQGVYPGMDGLKTGYTSGSGSNLVASARYGDDRVIAVIFGAQGKWQRHDDMIQLLDYGFGKMCDSTLVFNSRAKVRIPCRDAVMMETLPVRVEGLVGRGLPDKKPVYVTIADAPPPAPAKKSLFRFLQKKG